MVPSSYAIDPSDGNTPSVLVVGPAMGSMALLDSKTFPFTIPAEDIAKDIVESYLTAQYEYFPGDTDNPPTHPALFWVVGEFKASEIKTRFPEECKKAINAQHNWYRKLVKIADDTWAKNKQNRLITDTQRHAAKVLGFKREWIEYSAPVIELNDCPYCGAKVNKVVALCHNCKNIINTEAAEKLGINIPAQKSA
jgi:hypothetical protein